MTEFLVRYTVNNGVYETRIRTATSGSAINHVTSQFPNAVNVSVVGRSDINTL